MWVWLKALVVRLSPYAVHINPPVFVCSSFEDAQARAIKLAVTDESPCVWREVTPTGSMVPLIPAAKCFVVSRRIPFSQIRLGTVNTYWPDFRLGENFCHRFVAKDSLGYLASGDANPRTESWGRVTPANYEGEVIAIFVIR